MSLHTLRPCSRAPWHVGLGLLLLVCACADDMPAQRAVPPADDRGAATGVDDAGTEAPPRAPPPSRAPVADSPTRRDAAVAPVEDDAGSSDDDAGIPAACEVTAPTSCPDPPLRYDAVAPIFMQHCAVCHNGTDGRWPLTTYQHVADWWAEIRGQLLNCTMPPPTSGVVLPRAERERILAWIRCGFPR